MTKLEDLSNNELLLKMKQLEADHESLKLRIVSEYDKLIEIENQYKKANQIIVQRLKPDK